MNDDQYIPYTTDSTVGHKDVQFSQPKRVATLFVERKSITQTQHIQKAGFGFDFNFVTLRCSNTLEIPNGSYSHTSQWKAT